MRVDLFGADVTRLDLRIRRRAMLGYTLGMAAYVFVIVALYPTFKDQSSLDEFTKNGSKIAALFGATGSLTSPAGWLQANVYANFLPLIVLVLTMGYGAAALAGQDEDGTLALIVTLPLSRRVILAQKVVALLVHAIVISVVTALLAVAGRGFQLDLSPADVIAATIGVMLLGIDFGILALLLGALTGTRGAALGIASAVATVSYLISSLAPVTPWVHPLRTISLFYWAIGDDQLTHGLQPAGALVLLGTAAGLTVLAALAFDRLDVR
jgi:ABC-2 type transport system permease protein